MQVFPSKCTGGTGSGLFLKHTAYAKKIFAYAFFYLFPASRTTANSSNIFLAREKNIKQSIDFRRFLYLRRS
jgi:hypothetical protein